MSQGTRSEFYKPTVDLYVFDSSGEPVYYTFYGHVGPRCHEYISTLDVGRWYAVALASYEIASIVSIFPFSIGSRHITNGKVTGGEWLRLRDSKAKEQAVYVYYIKATGSENIKVSHFDLIFKDGFIGDRVFEVPDINLQTNASNKTYFSFYPSYKKFRFPEKQYRYL